MRGKCGPIVNVKSSVCFKFLLPGDSAPSMEGTPIPTPVSLCILATLLVCNFCSRYDGCPSLCYTWNRKDDNDTTSGIAILDILPRYRKFMIVVQKSPVSYAGARLSVFLTRLLRKVRICFSKHYVIGHATQGPRDNMARSLETVLLLLFSRKVFVLKDRRGPTYKSLSSDFKSLKIF